MSQQSWGQAEKGADAREMGVKKCNANSGVNGGVDRGGSKSRGHGRGQSKVKNKRSSYLGKEVLQAGQ